MRRRRSMQRGLAAWTAATAIALAFGGSGAVAETGPPGAEEPGDRGARADGSGRRHRPGIERVLEGNAQRLGLDDATRERIRALAAEGRERTDAQREVIGGLYGQLRALLSAEDPDPDAVLGKAEEIGQAKTALQKERLRTMLAIRALLTAEQRRELVRIHEEMGAQRGERGRDWEFGYGGRWRERRERE